MKRLTVGYPACRSLLLAMTFGLSLALCSIPVPAQADSDSIAYRVPDDSKLPAGPEGEAIRLGKALLTDTRRKLPKHVGNGLNCSNCHLGAGTQPHASPWVGLIAAFPEYRARSGKMISLQERINDCFERSMNGKALAYDSIEMNAMLSYIRWLSADYPAGTPIPGRGFVKIDTSLKPDSARGQKIYAGKCAACHGAEGQGIPDGVGGYVFPPLWGKDAFNVGAGMARHFTAAAFVLKNMPVGQAGSLSAQEAMDVAWYFTQQPRPDFPARVKDWPNGGKPADAR